MKPALILQHGLLGGPRNWSSVISRLPPHLFSGVRVPWLRNHGEGPIHEEMSIAGLSEDLEALLGSQKGPYFLMGSSYGGAAIMRTLLTGNFKLQSSLLMGSIIVDIAPCRHRPVAMPDLHRELGALMEVVPGAKSLADASSQLAKEIPSADQRGFLLGCVDWRRPNPPWPWRTNVPLIAQNLHALQFDLPDDGSVVCPAETPPVLFIFGQDSPYVCDSAAFSTVGKLFPNAQVEIVANAGHWVHIQQRDVFLSHVEDFVTTSQR